MGYCSKFVIPDREINNLFGNYDVEKMRLAFIRDWGLPPNEKMISNPYYHKLSILVLYGARNNKQDIAEYAIKLILYRMWNGRLLKLIKWCNPEIMASVVSNTKQRLIKKYSNPLDLIQQYFAPTLYSKYKSYILRDSAETKRLVQQCFSRLKQLFGSNKQLNLNTSEYTYTTGLQSEYYKAHEDRNKISSKGSNDLDQDISNSDIQSLIENITTSIIMGKTNYSANFVDRVYSKIVSIRKNTIVDILSKMHHIKYRDFLYEFVEIFLRRFRGVAQSRICSDEIYSIIETRIISSKNTQDVNHIKRVCDLMIIKIFETDFPNRQYSKTYMEYTDNARSSYRKIIIYGIGYNIQKTLCDFR